MRAVAGLIVWALEVYSALLLAVIIVSWVAPTSRHPAIILLRRATEPVLAPLRQILPNLGGFDFSPLAALLAIQFLKRLVWAIL